MTVETVPIAPIADSLIQKKNRIQVSNTKKPLFFYVNLAKDSIPHICFLGWLQLDKHNVHRYCNPREVPALIFTNIAMYIQQHNEVELSALGIEILKNNGVATEKSVSTSLICMKDENRGRMIQKAKIEIVLGKSEKFDTPAASPRAPAEEREPTSKDEM